MLHIDWYTSTLDARKEINKYENEMCAHHLWTYDIAWYTSTLDARKQINKYENEKGNGK